MLVTPPFGVSSKNALWRANIKPPVELVVGDLERFLSVKFILWSYTRLFCKIGFSPDKFRLFFLWQIVK